MAIAEEYLDFSELEQLEAVCVQAERKPPTTPQRGNFVYNLGNNKPSPVVSFFLALIVCIIHVYTSDNK